MRLQELIHINGINANGDHSYLINGQPSKLGLGKKTNEGLLNADCEQLSSNHLRSRMDRCSHFFYLA